MLQKSIQDNLLKATVALPKKLGQGVLINSQLILTAAHCIDCTCEGGMQHTDAYIEELNTVHGQLKVSTLAVEPVADIAVLGSLDNQEFSEEAVQFLSFCDKTKPMPICQTDFELFLGFPVYIYTPKGKWVTGTAQQTCYDAETLVIEADEQIELGTSGGPIVNETGELVGIVSCLGQEPDMNGKFVGFAPRPHLTLPTWVCRKVFA